MRCSAAVGCAGRLGGGLTASGCARWLTGAGLTATFAVGLALGRAARRGGAFFAAFFLIVLVLPTVFLCLAVLAVFLRFALALAFVAMAASLTVHCSWKVFVRSLPNKKVSQQARRASSTIDRGQARAAA